MIPIVTFLVLGAAAVVAASFSPALEGWAPLLALWVAGGAHMAWIVRAETKATQRAALQKRTA